jgi:hypothetical protein
VVGLGNHLRQPSLLVFEHGAKEISFALKVVVQSPFGHPRTPDDVIELCVRVALGRE